MLLLHTPTIVREGWFVISFIYVAVKIAKMRNKEARISEIVLLFHTPTIVKVLKDIWFIFVYSRACKKMQNFETLFWGGQGQRSGEGAVKYSQDRDRVQPDSA